MKKELNGEMKKLDETELCQANGGVGHQIGIAYVIAVPNHTDAPTNPNGYGYGYVASAKATPADIIKHIQYEPIYEPSIKVK